MKYVCNFCHKVLNNETSFHHHVGVHSVDKGSGLCVGKVCGENVFVELGIFDLLEEKYEGDDK
jgi:hypothetical protein